jgi:hypothetical protein
LQKNRIFIPDRDLASDEFARKLEAELSLKAIRLLCCPADPEVEIYCCVAQRDRLGASWEQVRASKRLKEEYFAPLLQEVGDPDRAGGGRDQLIDATLSKMGTLYQLCPEIAILRDRIAAVSAHK